MHEIIKKDILGSNKDAQAHMLHMLQIWAKRVSQQPLQVKVYKEMDPPVDTKVKIKMESPSTVNSSVTP